MRYHHIPRVNSLLCLKEPSIVYFKKKKFIYLFGCTRSAGSLVEVCGIKFPNQGSNLGPLQWESGVLATGPPEKSFNRLLLLVTSKIF